LYNFTKNFSSNPNAIVKNNLLLLKNIAIVFSMTVFFSACKKDPSTVSNKIQQGNNVIQMNVLYHSYLEVRYNTVINAPIHVTVTIYQNGKTQDVPVNIPAGYKSLQSWGNNNYINVWNYNAYIDSTGDAPLPVITGTVDSVRITAISCPDKEYGFKILVGTNDWTFYHPDDLKTTLSFISNKDTILFSVYDFESGFLHYDKTTKQYFFGLFNNACYIASPSLNYPLTEGMALDMPVLVYNWNGRNYGIQPDGPEAITNGSTLQLKITKISTTHFDATFSGKVWSSRQPDTLFISQGELENALLPSVTD
jgi:hypothetical protein